MEIIRNLAPNPFIDLATIPFTVIPHGFWKHWLNTFRQVACYIEPGSWFEIPNQTLDWNGILETEAEKFIVGTKYKIQTNGTQFGFSPFQVYLRTYDCDPNDWIRSIEIYANYDHGAIFSQFTSASSDIRFQIEANETILDKIDQHNNHGKL
jgi:hypothetical protein